MRVHTIEPGSKDSVQKKTVFKNRVRWLHSSATEIEYLTLIWLMAGKKVSRDFHARYGSFIDDEQ